MDKLRISAILLLCMLIVAFPFIAGDEEQRRVDDQENRAIKPSLTNTIKTLLSTSPSPRGTWDKAKTLMKQAQAYFSRPNLNFRGGDEGEARSSDGGAGEKLKEAATKSFEKSKANVEDSAKSAGNMAGETAQKIKEKVKKSVFKKEAEL
ncbi:hypothetical protein UlMin_031096 [Ulmus minor]